MFEFVLATIVVSVFAAVIVTAIAAMKRKEAEASRRLKEIELARQIRAKPLQEIAAEINLEVGEECYFRGSGGLLKIRTTKSGSAYHGLSVRVPVSRNVSYRASFGSGARATHENLVQVDNGMIYVTSKRVMFKGKKINHSVRLRKAISILCFKNGSMRIDKENGSPLIFNGCDAVVIEAVLEKILQRPIQSSDRIIRLPISNYEERT